MAFTAVKNELLRIEKERNDTFEMKKQSLRSTQYCKEDGSGKRKTLFSEFRDCCGKTVPASFTPCPILFCPGVATAHKRIQKNGFSISRETVLQGILDCVSYYRELGAPILIMDSRMCADYIPITKALLSKIESVMYYASEEMMDELKEYTKITFLYGKLESEIFLSDNFQGIEEEILAL